LNNFFLLGNTGGLPGIEGIKYAAGSPSPGIYTRTLPQLLGRLRKKLLEPFTGIGVDDYYFENETGNSKSFLGKKPFPLKEIETEAMKTRAQKAADDAKRIRAEAVLAANAKREADKEARLVAIRNAQREQEEAVQKATASSRLLQNKFLSKLKEQQDSSSQEAISPWKNIPRVQDFLYSNRETKNAEPSRKNAKPSVPYNFSLNQVIKHSMIQSKKTSVPNRIPVVAFKNKKENLSSNQNPHRDRKSREQSKKIEKMANSSKQDKVIGKAMRQSKLQPTPPLIPPSQEMFTANHAIRFSRTIALPKKQNDDPMRSSAASPSTQIKRTKPTNNLSQKSLRIPSLQKWRKNRDGSLTGYVFGSQQFTDNTRITTSSIVKGNISLGNIVVTTSGSKYRLG
jgi:hypothetical protein